MASRLEWPCCEVCNAPFNSRDTVYAHFKIDEFLTSLVHAECANLYVNQLAAAGYRDRTIKLNEILLTEVMRATAKTIRKALKSVDSESK